jgi:iron(III) transport system substrate-binding protein
MEYPVRKGITTNPILLSWGDYIADNLPLNQLGAHNSEAVKVMDRAGWK